MNYFYLRFLLYNVVDLMQPYMIAATESEVYDETMAS